MVTTSSSAATVDTKIRQVKARAAFIVGDFDTTAESEMVSHPYYIQNEALHMFDEYVSLLVILFSHQMNICISIKG